MQNRVGIGIDFHRFGEGRKLILGGVQIEHNVGLIGHSDADCLIHAIVDAILGAIGESDIGTFFPDSDMKYKDMNSIFFLKKAMEIVAEKGFVIENIDTTIICEKPRIMPYVISMKEKLGGVMNLSKERIGIKATTTEQMGFLGRKEGIACMAVALLKKRENNLKGQI